MKKYTAVQFKNLRSVLPSYIESCKPIKLFLCEGKIDLKRDMIQFSCVKTLEQKKGFILPVPKAKR